MNLCKQRYPKLLEIFKSAFRFKLW